MELERKVLERTKELSSANKKLIEIDKLKTDFLTNVSHELRTPLTSVLGFAKITRKTFEDKIMPLIEVKDDKTVKSIKRVQDNLGIIVLEGERLTALLNDVLDLAKIESGKTEWRQEKVNIAEVFEIAVNSVKILFEQKNLYLKTDSQDGDDLFVLGDKDKLIQVVINLLSNSVKFTQTGGVTYRIRKEDNLIISEVEDTGGGIPDDKLCYVFEKFKQIGDTLTDKPKGTGLGLPICKEILKNHRGNIWVESKLNEGSKFIFTIPSI
ncbi:PAS/PAC sensor signal transduction histidine kinase [Candidatus Magnetoovum chiemensis]|nr:PAS/PAC sensor signal transduction histidine kinase [Candidatus Magnetoovum chiemensis]